MPVSPRVLTYTPPITADGNYALGTWFGGLGTFAVHGTFNGGTLKLQYSADNGGNYNDVGPDCTLTGLGGGNFRLPGGWLLRVVATGFSGSITPYAGKHFDLFIGT